MTHLNGFSKNLSSLLPGFKNGGGERARTVDPLRARQVLSQLSYGPKLRTNNALVGHPGLEPGTSVLSGLRSNRLS